MVFAANKNKNEYYTFKNMLLQSVKSDCIIYMIKYIEAYQAISNWKIMKKIEVDNEHKHKYGKLKTIFQFGLLSARYSHMKDEWNTNPDSVQMEGWKMVS